MCTRLTQSAKAFREFQKRSGITELLNFQINQLPSPEVTAAQRLVGIAAYERDHRFLALTRWGTVVGDRVIYNARCENLGRSSLWAPSIQTQRILIPTDKFYEHGYWIRPQGKEVFALAGITVEDPDGGHDAVAITKDSVGIVSKIHNRMPVVVPEALWNDWLSPTVPLWMFAGMFSRDHLTYEADRATNNHAA